MPGTSDERAAAANEVHDASLRRNTAPLPAAPDVQDLVALGSLEALQFVTMVRTAILTVNETGAAAEVEDHAAQAIRQVLVKGPFVEVDYQLVPDEQALIRARLRLWSDTGDIDLVLSCGGIGLGMRGRTPEATSEVIERVVPGLPEAMRARAALSDPQAVLTRGLAGVRRTTLIVNLPSGAAQAQASLLAVIESLPAAVEAIRGDGAFDPSR